MTVEEALEHIREAHGGRLLPEHVVEAARDPASPLHSHFTWDDGEAAHRYRLWQARQLIRAVLIKVPTPQGAVRTVHAYVHVTKANAQYYQRITVARVDELESYKREILADLEAARRTLDELDLLLQNRPDPKRKRRVTRAQRSLGVALRQAQKI
ncbi:MAG: hypothetical protein KatS3mg109_1339 [Pirellulaceae bacterium]|nr:MAG: hypothetical protein KatS3mg109_0394 [Pirellulaceae bacterium]GIW90769.1 MAG: hypothetical protein KatS3mg109_1201 [Pirellulaceae bacterium]GIW90907.1 MAG: hypothetical protein KatS3mg109_1339 [Pirellulaceae bacterium]